MLGTVKHAAYCSFHRRKFNLGPFHALHVRSIIGLSQVTANCNWTLTIEGPHWSLMIIINDFGSGI